MISTDQFVRGLSVPKNQLHLLWKSGITVNNFNRGFGKYYILSCLGFLFHVPRSKWGKIATDLWSVLGCLQVEGRRQVLLGSGVKTAEITESNKFAVHFLSFLSYRNMRCLMRAASHDTMLPRPWQQYRGRTFTAQLFGDLSDMLSTNMLFFALGMLYYFYSHLLLQ